MRLSKMAATAITGMLIAVGTIPTAASAETPAQLQRRVNEMARNMEAMQKQMKMNAAVLKALKAQIQQNQAKVEAKVEKVRREARSRDPMDSADSKWHLAGYASTLFRTSLGDSRDPTFIAGNFNPGFHFQYKDLLLFEGELAFEIDEDGKTGLELEYTSLNLFATDFLTIAAGKFLSPIGQFQERLHPTWINKMSDPPAGFGHGGIQPLSEVGIMLRGAFKVGKPTTINYALFVGNGPQVELEGGELEAFEVEGFGRDDNANKTVGGRIGIVPVPHVEIGASIMAGKVQGKRVDGITGRVTSGNFLLWGVDAAFTKGPWDARFEYLSARLTSFLSQREPGDPTELIPRTDWTAWYVQVAYRMSGLTNRPVLRNFEPVLRYGKFRISGFRHFVLHGKPEEKISVGLNYWFSPSIVFKLTASRRDFTDPGTEDATEVLSQFAFGF